MAAVFKWISLLIRYIEGHQRLNLEPSGKSRQTSSCALSHIICDAAFIFHISDSRWSAVYVHFKCVRMYRKYLKLIEMFHWNLASANELSEQYYWYNGATELFNYLCIH